MEDFIQWSSNTMEEETVIALTALNGEEFVNAIIGAATRREDVTFKHSEENSFVAQYAIEGTQCCPEGRMTKRKNVTIAIRIS